MGKKVKNAAFISGNEAAKILKEIQKAETRRIVKSTLCDERSSRSHCIIIVDVPTVGGRLMLVDMAGSENIEQSGQNGLEAKIQTAKINQGNIALKRVVESIANGDSHVPFRDSKLTMLLEDSCKDVKSKILMILCASPDLKELHKTIATFEYGAKAKCIVRGPHTPIKDRATGDSSSAVILGSRIAALDQFVCKLQAENKMRVKQNNEAQNELKRKEEEISQLRDKLASVEEVNESARRMKSKLERKILECQKVANEVLEMERRKMEETMSQQQWEVEFLWQRLEDIEKQLLHQSRDENASGEIDGGNFVTRLMDVCNEDSDMVKSMDLSKSIDMETTTSNAAVSDCISSFNEGTYGFLNKSCLTTLYEEDEYENEEEDEVQKEVIEEKMVVVQPEASISNNNLENHEDEAGSRQLRIQNIFTLCGDYRELSRKNDSISKDVVVLDKLEPMDQNPPAGESFSRDGDDDGVEVFVKWEASKENPGKLITTLKVSKDSTLAGLRKLIEIHLTGEAFTFLVLGDPSGAPVPKEKESAMHTTKLPICSNHVHGGAYLACLRPVKTSQWSSNREPFRSMENIVGAAS